MAIKFALNKNGGCNALIPMQITSSGVGIKQNYSEIFAIDDLDKFSIITNRYSNYPNWIVYGSTSPSMKEKEKISSGVFGENGTKNVVNNPNRYPYFQIEVGPGSSSYMSHAYFSVATGIYQ